MITSPVIAPAPAPVPALALAHAPASPVTCRPVTGSIATNLGPQRRSTRLDLRHALSPADVDDLVKELPSKRAGKPWHKWVVPLALFGGLTAKQIALLRTDDLAFIHGHGWLSVPRSDLSGPTSSPPLMVPLHRELVALRFPGFVHSRYFAEAKETMLFPDLAKATRPGDAVESWLRRATSAWTRDGRHAPTIRDLRATAAHAALEGGASVYAVEAWMGLGVPIWDDRGPHDPETIAQVQREWVWEAVDAVAFPSVGQSQLRAHVPPAPWQSLLDSDHPILMPRTRAAVSPQGETP